jgi:hypothetical protein
MATRLTGRYRATRIRAELMLKYGCICAMSGPAPAEALEACHLHSYAEIGRRHDIDGGLLLRRALTMTAREKREQQRTAAPVLP